MTYYGNPIRIQTDEARAGSTPSVVRYVLAIGLVLAILALSAVWISGALTSPQGERAGHVTNQAPPQAQPAPQG
ncbi:MAG TPA: hypothetical protein VI199_15085 [Novosphingobium sp.]